MKAIHLVWHPAGGDGDDGLDQIWAVVVVVAAAARACGGQGLDLVVVVVTAGPRRAHALDLVVVVVAAAARARGGQTLLELAGELRELIERRIKVDADRRARRAGAAAARRDAGVLEHLAPPSSRIRSRTR